MIRVKSKNKDNQIITGRIGHEKSEAPFMAEGDTPVVLAVKQYSYQAGDKIVVTYTGATPYLMVQSDETLTLSLIYLKGRVWKYQIPLEESTRKTFVDTVLHSTRHQVVVRQAYTFEKDNHQSLSMNIHDQKEYSGIHPHTYAGAGARGDAVLFAKDTVDSKFGNPSHDSCPSASWGTNQRKETQIAIDLDRPVETDWIHSLLRTGYPHDSYWEEVTLAFSDGEEQVVNAADTACFQEIGLPTRTTQTLTLKCLRRALDSSPSPMLTRIEAFGRNK